MKHEDPLEQLLHEWADAPLPELPAGHRARMAQKLGHHMSVNSQKFNWIWAASIGLLFGLSIGWLSQEQGMQQEQLASMKTWHQTIQEQENQLIETIQSPEYAQKSASNSDPLSYMALKQLSKFDHEYQKIMRDFEHGGDPVLIFKALIDHFEKRIIFLETLKTTHEITQSDTYEKPSI
jgi:hypothetical protein